MSQTPAMKLSDAEWIVMNALWMGAPASAREILERIGDEPGWAYTTVKTMLSRLAGKGAVTTATRGNTTLFTPAISKDAARRTAVRSLLARAFDGAFGTLVHHIATAERLSRRERKALESLLREPAAGEPAAGGQPAGAEPTGKRSRHA